MKITFLNLGTIEKTEIDLRPLTVIIGPNNTSKTYVAYSIYGLWQSALASRPSSRKLPVKPSKDHVSFKIEDILVNIVNDDLRGIADAFQRRLGTYFRDKSGKLFADARFTLQANREEIEVAATPLAAEYRGAIRAGRVKLPLEKGPFGKAPSADLQVSGFSWRVTTALFQRPFLLPVERNAFVITYKLLSDRRYKLLKEGQSLLEDLFRQPGVLTAREWPIESFNSLREQGGVRYPVPIEDFLDFLTDIEFLDTDELPEKSPFQLLADEIDAKIHGNHRTQLRPAALGGREIAINLKEGLTIDLYNASSAIKQLAPLILYLRYRAKPNDFLIIDEPEMNLHPEAQAKLLEVLGILVNLGVRVLLTTHSPYFMSHINNLVAGDTAHPDVLHEQASSLYLKDPRAFLPMDRVSAYEMRNNELHSLKDEDYGIRWDTLSDVSSELQQKFFEISEKGRAGHGSDE